MRLLVGLGNPGIEYMSSRHNVGFMVLDKIAISLRVKVNKFMCKSLAGEGKIAGHRIVLAKPMTFMNLCGDAVVLLLERFRIDPGDILVIYDDLDLDLGTIRLRPKGGDGGHRGIRSIIDRLGTNQFPRLRVGIGRPEENAADYVLGNFTRDELVTVEQSIDRAVDASLCVARQGLTTAMNRYN